MKKEAICSVDITKDSGSTAHAIVRFPRNMRPSAQMNMLLLQHDVMAVRFAREATESVRAYYEVNQ